MAKKTSSHAAAHSAVGYYHQGLFALVTLLRAPDGARVSVETGEDVELVTPGDPPALHQLKHSLGKVKALTLKNDGFWNTLEIWCKLPLNHSVRFHFVTCAPLASPSPLDPLLTEGSDRTGLVAELLAEATRARDERAAAKGKVTGKGKPKPLPFGKRWPGCEAFLALSPPSRQCLVDLITLTPKSFTAAVAPAKVAEILMPSVPLSIRDVFVERLIAWWDRQVARSLIGQRAREILKSELQNRIHDLHVELSPDSLPDSYGALIPLDMAAETGRVMARQIALVNGGDARVARATIARWRARNQRDKWMNDDLAHAAELDDMDRRLVEVWQGRFGPLGHDCAGDEQRACQAGRDLLDWSHNDAHTVIPPLRRLLAASYLIQGSYQQLAELETVGWHPRYKELLKSEGD